MSDSTCTVFYDGSCPLCRREIALYRNRAEGVDFEDVSALPADAEVTPGLDGASAMARFHLRRPDGELVSGAAAFAELWRRTPGLRWLGGALRWPPLARLAEAAYRGFLKHLRPRVQRLVGGGSGARDG